VVFILILQFITTLCWLFAFYFCVLLSTYNKHYWATICVWPRALHKVRSFWID